MRINGIPFDEYDWQTQSRKPVVPPSPRALAMQADRRAEMFAGDPERTAMVSALPVLQQIALLNMRESTVRRRIVNRLMLDHTIEETPKLPDYAALVELGLASKQPYGRWHEPTREGRIAAATLERALCRHYQVHVLSGPENGSRYLLSYSCSCGWSTAAEKRSSNPDGSARRDHARHVERYRAGHTDEGDMAAALAVFEGAFKKAGRA